MPLITRWKQAKAIMREAGRLVLAEGMKNRGNDIQLEAVTECCIFSHIGRVVATNNVARAQVLQRRCEVAKRFLRIVGKTVVLEEPDVC